MSEEVANDQIRSTNQQNYDLNNIARQKRLYHYDNGYDAEVTIVIKGTYAADDAFSDAVQVGSTTVSAGGTDFDTQTDKWDQLRFEVTATTAPTSGTLTIREMK